MAKHTRTIHLKAAVEAVARRLDALDRAPVPLCDRVVVLWRNLDDAHGEFRNLGEAVERVLDLAQTLFVHPVVQHVARLQFEEDVVAANALLAVVGHFLEGVELDGRGRSAHQLCKLLGAHILLVLLVWRGGPSRREGAD
jgi:hypothetical protein